VGKGLAGRLPDLSRRGVCNEILLVRPPETPGLVQHEKFTKSEAYFQGRNVRPLILELAIGKYEWMTCNSDLESDISGEEKKGFHKDKTLPG
jgi:hypothetical protein